MPYSVLSQDHGTKSLTSADCNAQKFSRSGSWHPDSLFVRICPDEMAGRLLVSNGMQWLLTRVFRARELHRKSGLKATLGLGLKKLISPVARVGSVYLMASVSNQRN